MANYNSKPKKGANSGEVKKFQEFKSKTVEGIQTLNGMKSLFVRFVAEVDRVCKKLHVDILDYAQEEMFPSKVTAPTIGNRI